MRDFSLNFFPFLIRGIGNPKFPHFFFGGVKRTHVVSAKPSKNPKSPRRKATLRRHRDHDRSNESDFEKEEERTTSTLPFCVNHIISSSNHRLTFISERYKTPISLTTNIGVWRKEKGRQREDNRRKERKKRHHRRQNERRERSRAHRRQRRRHHRENNTRGGGIIIIIIVFCVFFPFKSGSLTFFFQFSLWSVPPLFLRK